MIGPTFPPPGVPGVNVKPCATCGHPKGRHHKRQWRESGIKRTVNDGPCDDTRCDCSAYQVQV